RVGSPKNIRVGGVTVIRSASNVLGSTSEPGSGLKLRFGQKRLHQFITSSFHHFVGGCEQRRGDIEAECPCGRRIHRQLELGRYLHGQIGRLFSLENSIRINRRLSEQLDNI